MELILMAGVECDELSAVLSRLGYQICYATKNDDKEIPHHCHLCLVDLRLEGFISQANYLVKQLDPNIHIIVLINKIQLESAEITTFIAQFAWDYCTSPIHTEHLAKCLGHGMGLARLKRQCNPQPLKVNDQDETHDSCKSEVMQTLLSQIKRVAATDIPVLIRGESGTGKALVAKKLHSLSGRGEGPFITVNCGTITSGQIQAELFDHEEGVFTAAKAYKGKIALADGGSLFLDDIGELPLELQVNLLRFLQEDLCDTVRGVGLGCVNVRIIAATHIDLERAIEEGHFRQDLYYQLNGIRIQTPPLRERRDDILSLAKGFVQSFLAEYNLPNKQLSTDAKQSLLSYSWPGNVRELINRVRRAVVLSDEHQITARHLELENSHIKNPAVMSLKYVKDDAEKQAIHAAILVAGGQADAVTERLKISRATLYRLMDKHGLQLL